MIRGRYSDGLSASALPANLTIGADGFVSIDGIAEPRCLPLADVKISDRIANIPRRLAFPDGAMFETGDNDAVDAALDAVWQGSHSHWLVRWERHWPGAVAALVAVALLSWLFIAFGIPALADVAARAMPASVDAMIGSEGLELMDRTLFAPSELSAARQAGLAALLERMAGPLADGHRYRLELRRGGRLGPNAFALPAGIIVMTDELVELARDEREIAAVLAHEIGHIRHRHALRMLLQDAGVAVLAFALLGDIGSASSLAAAIPVLLVQAAHSRDFEREADAYARQWLREQGLAEDHFDSMLCGLEKAGDDVPYLSTHPPLAERARCR
ncbi:MAG: M48 family metallopeptidase [Gammaproteobacteria bacterium]